MRRRGLPWSRSACARWRPRRRRSDTLPGLGQQCDSCAVGDDRRRAGHRLVRDDRDGLPPDRRQPRSTRTPRARWAGRRRSMRSSVVDADDRPGPSGRVRRAARPGRARRLAVRRVPRRRRRHRRGLHRRRLVPHRGSGALGGVRRPVVRRARQGRPQGRRRERRCTRDRTGPARCRRRPRGGGRRAPGPDARGGPVAFVTVAERSVWTGPERWRSTAPHCSPDRDGPARSGSSTTCHDRPSTRSPRRGCAPCSWRSPPVPEDAAPDRWPASACRAGGIGPGPFCVMLLADMGAPVSASTASVRRQRRLHA